METQNVSVGKNGHYTAQLGSSKPDGLPVELFTSGEARWLGVTINSGKEQLRTAFNLKLFEPFANCQALSSESSGDNCREQAIALKTPVSCRFHPGQESGVRTDRFYFVFPHSSQVFLPKSAILGG